MIAAILFSIIGLSLVFSPIIYAICDVVRNNKKIAEEIAEKERKHQEQLNSVIPGTILRKENKSNNPFEVSELSSIKILETKQNSSGEIWVKYAYENIICNGEYFESWPSYDSLENKIKLYPVIELPKN